MYIVRAENIVPHGLLKGLKRYRVRLEKNTTFARGQAKRFNNSINLEGQKNVAKDIFFRARNIGHK
uniref:Transposase n=1 Tax=Romanomermis culicivorax TaxID=13658 RepID=A0A915KG32_ROMCU